MTTPSIIATTDPNAKRNGLAWGVTGIIAIVIAIATAVIYFLLNPGLYF